MALHLIVDGYNLIGLRPRFWENWEAERLRLIERLRRYAQAKGHPVTVVFDGEQSGRPWEQEETRGRVSVIYSRQGEKADAVVARLARQYGAAGVVVSSDREVGMAAAAAGCVTLRAGEFERRLEASVAEPGRPASRERAPSGPSAEKVERPVRRAVSAKRGNPRRLSKADRQKRKRLAVL